MLSHLFVLWQYVYDLNFWNKMKWFAYIWIKKTGKKQLLFEIFLVNIFSPDQKILKLCDK